MYLQITSRCNFHCPHCCFSCTKRGEDMSLETFRRALEIASEHDGYLSIGGGEPTLHPLFEQFLIEGIAYEAEQGHEGGVFIATNGSITRRALLIAKLTSANIIQGYLSQDEYHSAIDRKVVEAFRDIAPVNSPDRHIRTVTNIQNFGRAKKNNLATDFDSCACDTFFVKPSGVIRQCGCPRSPVIGNTDTGINYDAFMSECCYRSQEYKDMLSEAA